MLIEDATTALLRATLNFLNFPATIEQIRSRGWASITFTGARHELTLRLDGDHADEAADRFCAGLETAEFDLRRHLLADMALVAREAVPNGGVRLMIEALTVEDV